MRAHVRLVRVRVRVRVTPCHMSYRIPYTVPQGVEAETYGFRCSGLRSEADFKPSEMLGFLMPRRRRKTESKL